MSAIFDRSKILDDIILRVSVMQECLKWHSKRGENDACKTAEDVVARFLAALCGWNLVNLNTIRTNYPAADLGDKAQRLAIQVTVNGTSEKIRETHRKAANHHLGKDFDRLIILFLLPQAPGDPDASDSFTPCTSPKIESWARPNIDALLDKCPTEKLREVLAVLENEMSAITEILRPVAAPRPCNLPEPIGDFFIGRDAFLDDLRKALTTTDTTVIHSRQAIHGMGGVGKTRTAIEYAWANKILYNALLFITADSHDALERNLAALCEPGILNLPEHKLTETEAQLNAAVRWLQANPGWFLLIDNADSPEAQEAVRKLTARIPHGHIVITSRRTDWPTNFSTLSLDVLDAPSSIRLLFKHTEGRRTPTPDDDICAAKIAGNLDGLCLALEQAAAYIRKGRLTFAAYLAAWEASSVLLHGQYGEKGLSDYHAEMPGVPRSLCVTYQTSLAELSEHARELFRILSWIAPDPMPVSAIEKIKSLPDPRSLLVELADLHLARLSADNSTCTVHRLLQEIARKQQNDTEPPALIVALLWLNEEMHNDTDEGLTWPAAVPLIPHAIATANFSADYNFLEPSECLLSQAVFLLNAQANYRVAEPLMRRVLSNVEARYDKNHLRVADSINSLATLLLAVDRLAEAEPMMRRALAIYENNRGTDHPDVARVLNNLATLLRINNRLTEVEPMMRRALAIDEKNRGMDHPQVAIDLNNLAQLLQDTNRLIEAESLYRRSLAITEASFDNNHPKVALRLGNLAQLLLNTDRVAEAEPLMRRALAIDEAFFGKNHPNVARNLNNLAQLLAATNRLDEAEKLYRRALAIDEEIFGKHHSIVATRLNNLAVLLHRTNRQTEAEPLLRRALVILETSYDEDHPEVARILNNLASLLQATDRIAEAEPLMRRHLEILLRFKRNSGYQHPNLETAFSNYIGLLEEMGDTKEQMKEKIRAVMAPFGMSIK